MRDDTFVLLFNAHHEPMKFALPGKQDVHWELLIDTRHESGVPPRSGPTPLVKKSNCSSVRSASCAWAKAARTTPGRFPGSRARRPRRSHRRHRAGLRATNRSIRAPSARASVPRPPALRPLRSWRREPRSPRTRRSSKSPGRAPIPFNAASGDTRSSPRYRLVRVSLRRRAFPPECPCE